MDDETISIASSNGDLFEWRMVDQSLECVGTMESGITCMKWSPDQEIFALTTGRLLLHWHESISVQILFSQSNDWSKI